MGLNTANYGTNYRNLFIYFCSSSNRIRRKRKCKNNVLSSIGDSIFSWTFLLMHFFPDILTFFSCTLGHIKQFFHPSHSQSLILLSDKNLLTLLWPAMQVDEPFPKVPLTHSCPSRFHLVLFLLISSKTTTTKKK